jgi:hypothetical protein
MLNIIIENENIKDISSRIVDELVQNGLIKDCTDTEFGDEWEAYDIIYKHIKQLN